MEITQRDRDLLRKKQQTLNQSESFSIGHLVEHAIQNPSTYITKSRQDEGLVKNVEPSLPRISYNSRYLSEDSQDKCAAKRSEELLQNGMSRPSVGERTDSQMEVLMDLPIKPEEVQANLWLNMDRIEFEKLEWMSQKPNHESLEKRCASVHFDSDGKAYNASDCDKTSKKELHDVTTLVGLLDSTFQPQVTYALTVISKIATRAILGHYDAVFDENIHEILLKECLLRVRHHLDSSNESTCQSALKCLRSLVCNTQIDEIFLDKLLPMQSTQPDATMWLCSDQENFDIEMVDRDCVETDAILGLIARTDILSRLKYLLNNKTDQRFSGAYHDCIIDMLIRVARHSQDMCWILHNNGLVSLVVEKFLPADIVRRSYLQQSIALRALKFLRIVVQAALDLNQSGEPQSDKPLIKLPDSIIDIVNTYYHIECEQDSSKSSEITNRIIIETLRLMKLLSFLREYASHILSTLSMNQNALVERTRALTNLGVLKSIELPSSLEWQYVAALLDVLGSMMNYERHTLERPFLQPLWVSFIRPQSLKWLADLLRDRFIPHQDVSIALYVATNLFFQVPDEQALSDLFNVLLTNPNQNKDTDMNFGQIYFKYLLRQALDQSSLNVFQETNGRQRDPKMLASYGFLDFNNSSKTCYKLSGLVCKDTPYIMLHLYLIVLRKSFKRFKEVIHYYLRDINLCRYMKIATNYIKYPMSFEKAIQQSYLGQMEIYILANAGLLLSKNQMQTPGDNLLMNQDRNRSDPLVDQFDSYSTMIMNVYSIIGLMSPDIDLMVKLKDSLLEEVIFDACLHDELHDESFKSLDSYLVFKYLKFNDLNRSGQDAFLDEDILLSNTDLLAVKSIYLSCEQPGRFWIFQPLLEYFSHHIEAENQVVKGKWFLENINKSSQGKLMPSTCDDVYVVHLMLKMNALLMYHSLVYLERAIRPNIEEYLCLIGSVFLNDDIFLDQGVNKALWYNLEIILALGLRVEKEGLFEDATKKIIALNMSLMDFFDKLVDQYESSSYNDVVFANYLLIFLSPKCDKKFRRKLFTDRLDTCLSQIRIASTDVWIPASLIFGIQESDPEIKCLIRKSEKILLKSEVLCRYIKHHTS